MEILKKYWIIIVLVLIIILSFFLRVYNINQTPGSLSPDEVALGYNSYSLLKTGADEHGAFFPLSLKSFGDWKLPVYPIIDILFIKFLGLSEFSVRIPSVIAGTIAVLLIYFISFEIFRKKIVALLSALLLSLSVWGIYFSRAAYEVNLALGFFLLGLLLFLKYIYSKNKDYRYLILSSLSFSICLFTYHSFAIFLPIFLFLLVFFNRKQIVFSYKTYLACFLFILFFLIFIFSIARGGSNKISTLVIFNDENIIYSRVEKLRGDNASENDLFARLIHNKYLGVSYQLAQNYIGVFNPTFLFDKGGEKLLHNLGSIGNLYLIDSVFILFGLAAIIWRRDRSLKIFLIWFLVAPIPLIITKDSPNSTMLFVLMPLFMMIASYGLYEILNYFMKYNYRKFFIWSFIFLIYFFNVIYFIDAYFIHFNMQRVRFWHYGYKEAVELTKKYPDFNVVMTGPENFPYIYFLFYEKYDPLKFRESVQYYPPTSEGFYFVKSFGKYQFVDKIDYSNLDKKTIYIDSTRLDDKHNSISLPSGEPIFGYYISL